MIANNLIGQTLGQYRVTAFLGESSLTNIYKAYHPSQERLVILQVLPSYYAHDEEFQLHFQREAEKVARLSHPNILPIYDFGQSENIVYLVLPYFSGRTLPHLKGQKVPLKEVGQILTQVTAALNYAHQQRLVHHQLQPDNIWLAGDNSVLVSGFGLARMLETDRATTKLQVGSNHPAYMSPEQGEGRPADARSDIYSLGIILYELVTGKVPFQAETPLAVVLKHLTAPLPLPRTLNPALPEGVEQVILKALAKDPEHRYSNAAALMAAFEAALGETLEPPLQLFVLPTGLGQLCPRCRHLNRSGVNFCEYCAALLGTGFLACAHCGYSNRSGVTFCEQCAAPIGPTCAYCGQINRPGVRFCEQCASLLVEHQLEP